MSQALLIGELATHQPGQWYADRTATVEEVLRRIAEGEAITAICADRGMPSVSTFFRWCRESPQVWQDYVDAREVQAHVFASRVVDEAFSATDAGLGALRVKSLQWSAARLAPKHYGDGLQLRHADADGQKLDTQPLVSELLGLMGGAQGGGAIAARVVSTAPAELERQAPARSGPAYQPRSARSTGVEDLV